MGFWRFRGNSDGGGGAGIGKGFSVTGFVGSGGVGWMLVVGG
jgi:hypothetical protein